MTRALTSILLLVAVLAGVVLGAAPASAVTVAGHGAGFLWKVDRSSWIGSYRLGDGPLGLCLEVTRPTALGSVFHYEEVDSFGGLPADDRAALAFIARTWVPVDEMVTAAAAQLTVWRIAGLGGRDAAFYAQRANEHAATVLAQSDAMLARARSEASRSVSARVTIDLTARSVVPQLVVDRTSSGPTVLEPGSHLGTLTLRGATFEDGTTTRRSLSGVAQTIVVAPGTRYEEVTAAVDYTGLPYGTGMTIGSSENGHQDLLTSTPVLASAHAEASAQGPSPLPFSPRVTTRTSLATTTAGALLSDELVLSATGDGLGAWGVYEDGDDVLPVPVVIESVLYGPLPDRPLPAAAAPTDAPVACRVETAALDGPGTYRTPGCSVPAAGWYTWTALVDPARTPIERGGDRVGPWTSTWGEAVESTLVTGPPTITTVASSAALDSPGCVSDALTVSGLPEGSPGFPVTATLIGPLPDRPEPGSVSSGWRLARQAGSAEVTVTGDGRYTTECIEVEDPGHYHFVLSSPGSDVDGIVMPAFEDATVYATESLTLSPPPAAPAPRPLALASTGRSGGIGSSGLCSIALAVLCGAAAVVVTSARIRPSRSARS